MLVRLLCPPFGSVQGTEISRHAPALRRPWLRSMTYHYSVINSVDALVKKTLKNNKVTFT